MEAKRNEKGRNQFFGSTRWTMVMRAGKGVDDTEGAAALAELCEIYRRPILALATYLGYADPEDLTQEFFELLIRNNLPGRAGTASKGKFRSFLITCFRNFAADQIDKQRAAKRGGHAHHQSMDETDEEGNRLLEPADGARADQFFLRQFAAALVDRTLKQLEQEYLARNFRGRRGQGESLPPEELAAQRKARFHALIPCITERGENQSYAALGQALGMSESHVAKEVCVIRQDWQRLIREEVSHTLPEGSDVEKELRFLLSALS